MWTLSGSTHKSPIGKSLIDKNWNIDFFAFSACSGPLGMESGKMKNSQLTASSIWSDSWKAVYARLNSGRFWGPAGVYGQWLQIAFERETAVTKVATQGSVDKNYWVTDYKISSSNDGLTWSFIMTNGANKLCRVTHFPVKIEFIGDRVRLSECRTPDPGSHANDQQLKNLVCLN